LGGKPLLSAARIHIDDFFFYNMSGTGGGVEDLNSLRQTCVRSLSASGFSDLPEPDANNKAGFSKANYDLRLYTCPALWQRLDSSTLVGQRLDAAGNSAPVRTVRLYFLHTREE
jgi:maltoporin